MDATKTTLDTAYAAYLLTKEGNDFDVRTAAWHVYREALAVDMDTMKDELRHASIVAGIDLVCTFAAGADGFCFAPAETYTHHDGLRIRVTHTANAYTITRYGADPTVHDPSDRGIEAAAKAAIQRLGSLLGCW